MRHRVSSSPPGATWLASLLTALIVIVGLVYPDRASVQDFSQPNLADDYPMTLAEPENPPLTQKLPSAHVTVHYYCPDCPQSEKDHVAWCASIINHGTSMEFEHLLPSHPEVDDLINIRYRFIQYVQFMELNGDPNSTGEADLAMLAQFAATHSYNMEEFFLHWDEPTRINRLGVSVVFDGAENVLIDNGGGYHYLGNDRAVAVVWGDFYYLYDWHSEAWYQFILWRAQNELSEDHLGCVFDGYFQDVLNGPITDTFQGISYGGGLEEFGGKTPAQITGSGEDHDLIRQAQARLNADMPGKVFMPNSGNYTQDWALATMLAGDGTITEGINIPGERWWKESWDNAAAIAAQGKFYSLSSFWEENYIPWDFDPGIYASRQERGALHNAAWYWMAYEPGYVSFDVNRACCNWSEIWPVVMETDLGSPIGAPYIIDEGDLNSGWHWTLYARPYTKATVYYRGNAAWRYGNGASIGYAENTGAGFSTPPDSKFLRSDGSWSDAPATVTHMEAFGLVIQEEQGDDDDDCTSNEECEDSLFCNGEETCNLGTHLCEDGDPVLCDDGLFCTGLEYCDETGDTCRAGVPIHCDDGVYCNGFEYCNEATNACADGEAIDCQDNIGCTVDSCNEQTRSCDNLPDDGVCLDQQWCNGNEYCNEDFGCLSGTAPDCIDGVGCTADSCDEAGDRCLNTPDDGLCDNGDWCDGAETCHRTAGCQIGTAPCPDDSAWCNGAEGCDEGADACTTTGDPCSGFDYCCEDGAFCSENPCGCQDADHDDHYAIDPSCPAGDDCNDANPSVHPDATEVCNGIDDNCQNGADETGDSLCANGIYCDGPETCNGFTGCQVGSAPDCNDEIDCTADSCNEAEGRCDNLPNDALCTDGAWCNGDEYCSATEGCRPGTAPNCNDGIDCTVDGCNEYSDSCTNSPNHSACNDQQWCNGTETCDAQNGCLIGTAPDCADGVTCTIDVCNEQTDSCSNVADDAACDDGAWCNGQETCHPTADCLAGVPPCPSDNAWCNGTEGCDEGADICTTTGGPCSGYDYCCEDGAYCSGAACGCQDADSDDHYAIDPSCPAGDDCDDTDPDVHPEATEICNGIDDNCAGGIDEGADSLCDNGAVCDGAETCNGLLGCLPGAAPNCNDQIACTTDYCDEQGGGCQNDPMHSACQDALYCNGQEICSASSGCLAGLPPNCNDGVICTNDNCNEQTDSCDHDPYNFICDDGVWCNGMEKCDAIGGCGPADPPDCNDDLDCTADSCNEAADRCDNIPNNAVCDDQQWCNGAEYCDTEVGCSEGAPPNCNDTVGCTADSCNEQLDICIHTPNNYACDDGQWCNGDEYCDQASDCQPGTPVSCADTVGCTVDVCNEQADECRNIPDNTACDDDLWCNGAESCHQLAGCLDGQPPCPDDGAWCTGVEGCNESTDVCTSSNIPCQGSDYCCEDGAFCSDEPCGCQDADKDQHFAISPNCPAGDDCNDTNPDIHPDITEVCNGIDDNCQNGADETGNGLCDDGAYCDGFEICLGFQGCMEGAAPNCNDEIDCTSDSCNEQLDRCDNIPSNLYCNDAKWCNGEEYCDALSDCRAGVAPNCADAIDCTADICNEETDACDHLPIDEDCDDWKWCNGIETCDRNLGCLAGSVPCTDDQRFCNGAESCNEAEETCDHTGNPCQQNETCDEDLDSCFPDGDDDDTGSDDDTASDDDDNDTDYPDDDDTEPAREEVDAGTNTGTCV